MHCKNTVLLKLYFYERQTNIIKPIGSLQPAMETTVSEDYIHYGDSHKMLYTRIAKSHPHSQAFPFAMFLILRSVPVYFLSTGKAW